MKKTLIIGAGITGLSIAMNLPNSTVVEKSKGLGGRLATRRWQNQKFDHGAQFYKFNEDTKYFHELFKFTQNIKSLSDNRWCATNGMSSLAKKIAENANVQLEKQVVKIVNTTEVHFLDGSFDHYDQIIFTCPLPQSLKILESSMIPYPERLNSILYAKALVFLLSADDVRSRPYSEPYVENPTKEIFSFTDQNWKSNGPGTAWTITMNPSWSEKHFDRTDEEIITQFKKVFSIENTSLQLKKWRYSHPLSQDTELCVQLGNIILAGDAFGGGSINGSLRSAADTLRVIKT